MHDMHQAVLAPIYTYVHTRMCADTLLQVLRQTQALKESLSSSDSRVTALQAEVAQLTAELEACKQKAVTDQEQVCHPCQQTAPACVIC